MILLEQEQEYKETKRKDMENNENIEILKAIEQSKISFITEKKRLITEEPDIKKEDIYMFKIKLPSGLTITRRFSNYCKIKDIRNYIDVYLYENKIFIENYNLISNFPKVCFEIHDNDKILKDCISEKNTLLYINNLD